MKISKKYLSEVIKHLIFESTDLRPYQDIMQEFLKSQEPETAKKLLKLAAYSPVQANSLAPMFGYEGNNFTTDLVFYANKDFEGLLVGIYQLENMHVTYDSINGSYSEDLEGVAEQVILSGDDVLMIAENIVSFFENAGAPITKKAAYRLFMVCAIDISSSVKLEFKRPNFKGELEKQFGKEIVSKLIDESLNESEAALVLEKCWPGYEKKGMKKMFGKMYPNCVKKSKKKKKKNENVDIKEAHGLSKKDAEYIKKFAEKTKDKELKKILNFLVTSNIEVDVTHDVTKDKKNEEVKAEVIEEKAASASYCKKTPCKKMGFTQKASCKSQGLKDCYPKNEAKDPKKGTGKKPKGSGRRLYTDENPKDTVSVKFKTVQDIKDTLSKESFKSKSHKRQSQIINLIHQRARAAYQNAKDPKVKARLKKAYDYAEKRKEASKEKTKRMNKKK